MYIPRKFNQQDKNQQIAAIRAIQFGALAIHANDRFYASHLPFFVKLEDDIVILEGHVARANEIWQVARPENKTMVIFQGQNSYIHPGWYPTKKETEKVVPTWNYQVVHCHGYANSEQTEHWLLNNITDLTNFNERNQTAPWQVNDAPPDHIKSLLKAVVGIKVNVDHIESALKMNQNQTAENRHGVIRGLTESNLPNGCGVAQIMQQLEMELNCNRLDLCNKNKN